MSKSVVAIQGEHYAYFDYEPNPLQAVRYIFDTLEHAQAAAAALPTLPEWHVDGVSTGMLRQCRPEFNDGWKPEDSQA